MESPARPPAVFSIDILGNIQPNSDFPSWNPPKSLFLIQDMLIRSSFYSQVWIYSDEQHSTINYFALLFLKQINMRRIISSQKNLQGVRFTTPAISKSQAFLIETSLYNSRIWIQTLACIVNLHTQWPVSVSESNTLCWGSFIYVTHGGIIFNIKKILKDVWSCIGFWFHYSPFHRHITLAHLHELSSTCKSLFSDSHSTTTDLVSHTARMQACIFRKITNHLCL